MENLPPLIGQAYGKIIAKLEETGVAYEHYLDPPEVPIEKTRTVIVFPLK